MTGGPASTTSLFLGSSNPGKLREFSEAARKRDIVVAPVPALGEIPSCIEDGLTFEANARKKALHYARYTAGLVFADDSGICVDALGGAPGVHSARFSGPNATDEANNAKLLSELRRVSYIASSGERLCRTIDAPLVQGFPAKYVCLIALARGERILALVDGECEGLVIETPRGSGGFGYDPYFFYPPLGKTFAEISAEEKFRVSHRGIAFQKLLKRLASDLRIG